MNREEILFIENHVESFGTVYEKLKKEKRTSVCVSALLPLLISVESASFY